MKKILITLLIIIAFPVFAAGEEKKDENFFIVVPVPLYKPETQWSLYLIAEYIFKLDHKDLNTPASAAQISLSYTQLNQSDIYLEFSHYWKNSEYYLKVMLEYMKYPDKFFGIGNNDRYIYPGLDRGYDYTMEFEYAWIEFQKKIIDGFFTGVRYMARQSVMLEAKGGSLLPGAAVAGEKGGFDSGIGILVKWDTRDNVYYSTSGDYLQCAAMFFGDLTGGESHFTKLDLDMRHYFKISDGHSVSLQGLLLAETGNPPFYLLNMLGGEKVMRGYYKGSYTDRCNAVLQAEYKWLLFSRYAVDFNTGLGAIAPELTKLSAADLLWSAGLGFRYIFDESSGMTARIDIGFGNGTMGVYLVAGEAF